MFNFTNTTVRDTIHRLAVRWVVIAQNRDQFELDEAGRRDHVVRASRSFTNLLTRLQPFANKVQVQVPGEDPKSIQQRGRLFMKLVQTERALNHYLTKWIGTKAQHPQADSWRTAVVRLMRDVLVYGKDQREVLVQLENHTSRGFETITMAQAQAPLRKAIPAPLRAFLPKNIVVDVDERGVIQKMTDRFENEHFTLGAKIERMHELVRDYNKVAQKVKSDIRSGDEITRMSAIITAILMETGIRPGKAGNGKVVTSNGEDIFIETFGAVTLGPSHVQFVRTNFARLEFAGKKTTVNTAEIQDSDIIRALDDYVRKALSSGSKFIFVTADGHQYSYSNLQKYFRDNFKGISPTDFRKLKATDTVLSALREEQVALYDRIREFASSAKSKLKDRVVEAVTDAVNTAILRSQVALSHEDVETTIRAYINPEVIFRFLSTGHAADRLEDAILSGETVLRFDPQVFIDAAGLGRRANLGQKTGSTLGKLLIELKTELKDAGIRKIKARHHGKLSIFMTI